MSLTPLSVLKRFVCLFYLVLTILCLLEPHLVAQPSSPASTPSTKSASYLDTKQIDLVQENQMPSAILQILSEQIGRSILLDGKPLLKTSSFNLHTSAKVALDEVAARLDCTWTLSKQGVILMNKQFHVPGDLPQMNLKEMQKMAHDLLSIWPERHLKNRLSYYPFTTVEIYPANALFRTFTPQQLDYLKTGQRLTFHDLLPAQQDLVRLGILNGLVETSRDAWEGLDARLAGMSHSYLQWRPWEGFPPHPLRYSLNYLWPDPQDRGFERILPAEMVPQVSGEDVK